MRYPRNLKIFRGQLDAAPWASLCLILLMFFLFQETLFFTPGIRIRLPAARGVTDSPAPSVVILMDLNGRFFLDQQQIGRDDLVQRLRERTLNSKVPMVLKVMIDEGTSATEIAQLAELAEQTGFGELLLPTRPLRSDPEKPRGSNP